MRNMSKSKIGLGAVGVLAISLGLISPAMADDAAQPNDIVGVGSDTLQYGADFLMYGDASGNAGYNSAGNINRAITLDATADANGRTSYSQGSTISAPVPQNPTFVLRAGQKPIVRINGSAAGITAILADTGAVHNIQYVRASRLPKAAEQASAAANGWGGLHVFQFATDPLQMAVASSGTNAPAGLSPAEVVKIYQGTYVKWGDIPGYAGPAPTATIIPILPQAGSGTRGSFDADMKTANGGVAVVYGPACVVAEEHDYTAIAGSSSPINTISPFSTGRIALNNSGYFGAPAQNQVVALTGTTPDSATGGAFYNDIRGLYFLVRDTDLTIATPWQPGGAKNWAKTLFQGTTSQIAKASSAPNIVSAGFTPSYADLGDASSG